MFPTKKYEFHQENQKNYALDPDQELLHIFKMLHSSLNRKKLIATEKNKNMMLFLVAVSEREFPVSVRNSEISSKSGMFLIPQSEDKEN